jgi:hypothetical protein
MKTTCLLFLTMSCATLTHGTGYAVPFSPAIRLSKFEISSSSQCGSAAPLCGKPLAFRPASPISLSQRRLEGAAFQTALRRSANVHAPRKGEAFPHSGAAEPLVSTNQAFDEQRDHAGASEPNHPPSRASLTKANRPKQLPNSRQRSMPGNALHQPGPDKFGGAAKGGLIPNETVSNALAVRTPSVVRPTVLSPNNVRHRSPNPAVVGGSPTSRTSNAGAINGTRMNRKP